MPLRSYYLHIIPSVVSFNPMEDCFTKNIYSAMFCLPLSECFQLRCTEGTEPLLSIYYNIEGENNSHEM